MYSQLLQRVVQTPAHFAVQTIHQDRVGVTDHIFFHISLKSSYKSTDINLAKLPWNNLEHGLSSCGKISYLAREGNAMSR